MNRTVKQVYLHGLNKSTQHNEQLFIRLATLFVLLVLALASNKALGAEQTKANKTSLSDCYLVKELHYSTIIEKHPIVDRPSSWWLSKSFSSTSKAPDIVILGDSQLGALFGADAYVYNKLIDIAGNRRSQTIEHDLYELLNKHWQVLIAGLPEAMITDQSTICHALFQGPHKPKLVVLAISPRAFLNNSSPSLSEVQTFFSKYIDHPISSISRLQDNNTCKFFPTIVAQGISEHGLSLTLGKPFELICPGELVICPGDNYLFDDDTNTYKLRYNHPFSIQFKTQMNCFDSLLSYLANQHIKVVVFDMPLTKSNRVLLPNAFWKLYLNQISQICKKHDSDFIDINNDWGSFTDEDFIDGVHLNLAAGLKLTRPIALFVANKFHEMNFEELRRRECRMF